MPDTPDPAGDPPRAGTGGIVRQTFPADTGRQPLTRILYVDDEPSLCELAKCFLEDSGEFSVTTAPDAEAGLALLSREPFDAVVSDYMMPRMDGIRFLQIVRERIGRIPFILFTGRGREEVVIQAINSGVDFYLQKGGEPEAQFAELAHKLRQATSRHQAEDMLRQREEGYRHMLEYSAEPLCIIQDGLVRGYNHPATGLLGYPDDELIGAPFERFIHPDDRKTAVARYRSRVGGTEAPSQYTIRLVHNDGRTIWIAVSTVAITWDRRPATINSLVDITARIEAEEALARTKDWLDRILNTVADPVFVKDERHRRVLVNDAYCRFMGRPREELLDRDDHAFYPPEIAEALGREDNEVLATGAPRVSEDVIPDREGRPRITLTKKALLTGSGGEKYVVGVARDLSEFRQAEEDLRRTRQNYEAFLNSIGEFLFVIDADGRIQYANAAVFRVLGYAKEELYGRPVLVVHPPDRRDEAAGIVHAILAGERGSCPVPLMAKDGRVIPVETRISRGTWDGKPAIFGMSRERPGS